jgi:hypothetical protein
MDATLLPRMPIRHVPLRSDLVAGAAKKRRFADFPTQLP